MAQGLVGHAQPRPSLQEEVVSEQEGLEGKLRSLLGGELGPAGRRLLGRAFVVMYERGNILGLHGMVGRCCDVLKSKDEGQSPTNSKQYDARTHAQYEVTYMY